MRLRLVKPPKAKEYFISHVPDRILIKLFIDQFVEPTLYECAFQSGMNIVEVKHGITCFTGNKEAYTEYLEYCDANKKAIKKEQKARYKL